MEMVVVSMAAGVMKPLLVKLTALMGDEYKKLTEVRKMVPLFNDELSAMGDFLEKLADYDQLDPQIKGWRDRVREMAYDIEDLIDNLLTCHDSSANVKFLQKMPHYLKRLKEHRQVANQFEELWRRVKEESERYKRYKTVDLQCNCNITDIQSGSSIVAIDPRVTALYKMAASLVGIDGPREELIKRLVDMEKRLKVISIVGFGGLGKTTLAKEVYQKIGGKFSCTVFVSVSQRPDLTRLLKDIQTKLGILRSSDEVGVRDILDSLTGHLKHKRYLIVVDDLWDIPEWDIILCAFPDNNEGSRVIVTTRVEDVATRASSNPQCIYKMKPLNHLHSRRLFLNRIFGSEDGCPSHYKEVSAQILKKCGGLPLAIITIASLLASRPERLMDEWVGIRNSLGDPLDKNPTLEGMRQILYLSYKHLPHHLRTCLLYLGKYPEDHEIKRDDVVRQWMAEGFVSTCRRQGDEEDVAKSYFNELVNRSLIQPERSDFGEVLSCRVHDMMLDLILKICAEDNFITVAYNSEDVAREHKHKVRRLSLHSNAGIGVVLGATAVTTSLSKVRSFSLIIGGLKNLRPPLLQFHKYLRVLDLQVIKPKIYDEGYYSRSWAVDRDDLTIISQLFHLRYLKLGVCANYIKIPPRINRLEHLETLEILEKWNMPPDFADLPRLSRLVMLWGQRMPKGTGLGKMKSLRTLAGFDMLSLDTKALGELTNLRDLRLCTRIDYNFIVAEGHDNLEEKALHGGAGAYVMNVSAAKGVDSFYSSIGKLSSLRYLEIRPWGCVVLVKDDGKCLGSLSHPPPSMEILKLKGFLFSRIPQWITAGALNNLRRLELLVSRTSTEELGVLGELPSLLQFVLELETGPPAANAIVFGTRGFPAMESLCFYFCDANAASYMGFQFQAGAMPKLQRLTLQFDPREWGRATPVGLEHLLALQHIHVEFRNHGKCYSPPSVSCGDTERALRNTAESHPSRPSFTFKLNLFPLERTRVWEDPYR